MISTKQQQTLDRCVKHTERMADELESEWVGPHEAAEILGVTTSWVHQLAKSGQLPHAEPPGKKSFLYYRPLLAIWRKIPRPTGRPPE